MSRHERTVDLKKWSGPLRRYDLVKEFLSIFAVVAVLAITLAGVFSSGDEPEVTMKSWARISPVDFAQTAATELAGTSGTATYGAPYNSSATGQVLGPLKLQKWAGVHIPIDSAKEFVITPLRTSTSPRARTALADWDAASIAQQHLWATAYGHALAANPTAQRIASAAGYGPVPQMLDELTAMAKSGALDGALTTATGTMTMDYTKPWLFLGDSGSFFPGKGEASHLGGDQWGMTNEPGSYPGQPWLLFVSVWYQIEPFKSSENADIQILALVAVLGLALIFLPLIPGLRRIPHVIPVHRLIWRQWYRNHPPHR